MSEIIDCPVCGDTVEEHIAQAGEERIRADERERLSKKIKNNISERPSLDNPHRNYILGFNDGLKGAIEAIKAE